MNRIVYHTDWKDSTVTIDYNATLRLFLTQQEHFPFSPERILRMLDEKTKACRVQVTAVGLSIVAGEVRCVLTQQAVNVLGQLYHSRRDLQLDFPFLAGLFCPTS